MNKRHASAATPSPGERPDYVRLPGRWPRVMQAIWVALAAVLLSTFVTTLPSVDALMRTPCQPGSCPWLQYTTPQMAAISHTLLPYDTYISVALAFGTASLVVMWSVSAVIIWRRPDDWMAALVAFALLIQGTALTTTSVPLGATPWLNPRAYVLALLTLSAPTVFALFPNGHFVPRWTRWLFIVNLMLVIPLVLTPIYTPLGPLGWVVTAINLLALAVAQIYRYRVVSTPLERQQTKWALVGFAAPVALVVALIIGASFAAALGASPGMVTLLSSDGGFVLPFGLAIGFGFAMLRSRLWDVDLLINRTLVYGSLTAILAAVYFGVIVAAQAAVGTVDLQASQSPVIVVATTLFIAALFTPLRRGLQALIDRRFYRSKYDAARTIEAFAATLRTDLDLGQVTAHMLEVVQETMHPESVQLWLRDATAVPRDGRAPDIGAGER